MRKRIRLTQSNFFQYLGSIITPKVGTEAEFFVWNRPGICEVSTIKY